MDEEIPNRYKAASEYHTINVVSYGDIKLWVSVIGKGVMIDQLKTASDIHKDTDVTENCFILVSKC